MLSAPEGVACLQTTAGFTQREDTQPRDQAFTSEYLCSQSTQISRHIFLRFSTGCGVEWQEGSVSTCRPVHTVDTFFKILTNESAG